MARGRDLVLRHWQGLPFGNGNLHRHQIKAGDFFGHRMFDLKARVHFHEPEAIGPQRARTINDEFDRSGTLIVHGFGGCDRRGAHGLTNVFGHVWRGGLFDHLLMAALHGTVAFKQVNDVAMRIAHHLHFDVSRVLDELFDQTGRITKTGLRLTLGRGQSIGEIGRLFDQTHPLTTATCARFDQDRIADFISLFCQKIGILFVTVIAGNDRHTCLFHQSLSLVF